jgi:hypothetical protein
VLTGRFLWAGVAVAACLFPMVGVSGQVAREDATYNRYTGVSTTGREEYNPYRGTTGRSESDYNRYTGKDVKEKEVYNPYTNRTSEVRTTTNAYTGRTTYSAATRRR